MNLNEALALLPGTSENVVSVLSGGLDSTVMTYLLVQKYGNGRVKALSFNYGQKQKYELTCASATCKLLKIPHSILNLKILGNIVRDVSANIGDSAVEMPSIKEVLGDPQPKTYVPFRNMILNSIAFSYAEANKASHIFTGLQVHDEYGYWDTTQRFVDAMNNVAAQNRTHKVKMMAPFAHLSKYQEILLAAELPMEVDFSKTLTCYNPQDTWPVISAKTPWSISCGKCPSCSERIANFAKAGLKDPISYSTHIPWDKLLK
ncbi:MAG: 7-cyano-7-deazaguanine synthase QueC [Ginsengibacter sp.]